MAQTYEFGNPTDLSVRVGAAFPLDKSTRSNMNDVLMGIGFDYFLPRALVPGANGESTISVDWLSKSIQGSGGNMFPIMLNQRWYNNEGYTGLGDRRTYFFAGIGLVVIDFGGSSNTSFGGRAGIGVEFGEHLFGEASLVLSDEHNGASATNVGLWLGYRF